MIVAPMRPAPKEIPPLPLARSHYEALEIGAEPPFTSLWALSLLAALVMSWHEHRFAFNIRGLKPDSRGTGMAASGGGSGDHPTINRISPNLEGKFGPAKVIALASRARRAFKYQLAGAEKIRRGLKCCGST